MLKTVHCTVVFAAKRLQYDLSCGVHWSTLDRMQIFGQKLDSKAKYYVGWTTCIDLNQK